MLKLVEEQPQSEVSDRPSDSRGLLRRFLGRLIHGNSSSENFAKTPEYLTQSAFRRLRVTMQTLYSQAISFDRHESMSFPKKPNRNAGVNQKLSYWPDSQDVPAHWQMSFYNMGAGAERDPDYEGVSDLVLSFNDEGQMLRFDRIDIDGKVTSFEPFADGDNLGTMTPREARLCNDLLANLVYVTNVYLQTTSSRHLDQ